jgi:hypothetical protein
MSDKFKPSQDALSKVKTYEEADTLFKAEWEKFEKECETRFTYLEKLRDDRNAKLDEAKRQIRSETESLDEMRMTFALGPFKVQKKWSDFYIPEKLVAMLTDRGLYDAALSAGIVAIKTEVAKYPQVKKFLEDNNVARDFECCEDGAEDSTAIGGPKSVPPFGSELKKE